MAQLSKQPLTFFKVKPQVRKAFDEADLRRLGASMLVKQLQPVLCQPDGTLIAGERRLRAAQLVGMETLECLIADEELDETEMKLWQFQENTQRDDLKLIEEVDGIAEIARLNPTWNGKDLAARFHLDASMISRMLSIANCPIAHSALADGRLTGLSDAYRIAAAPAEMKEGLLRLRLSGATREELEKAVKKKPESSAGNLSRIRISLVSQVIVVVSGPDLDFDALIEALTQAREAAVKANKENLSLKVAQSVWTQKAKAATSSPST